MLRSKIILALSFFAVAFAVPEAQAVEAAPIVLVHEGERYEYYVKLDEDLIKIDGILTSNGDKFALTVMPSGRVTGYFGNIPVDYSVERATRDRLAARLNRQQAVALLDVSNR